MKVNWKQEGFTLAHSFSLLSFDFMFLSLWSGSTRRWRRALPLTATTETGWGTGLAQGIVPKDMLPVTCFYQVGFTSESLHHLSVKPSNYKSISGLIHCLCQSPLDQRSSWGPCLKSLLSDKWGGLFQTVTGCIKSFHSSIITDNLTCKWSKINSIKGSFKC